MSTPDDPGTSTVSGSLSRAFAGPFAYLVERVRVSRDMAPPAVPMARLIKPRTLEQALDRYAGRFEVLARRAIASRSEEHKSELKSLMRISYAVFCWQKNKK